MGNSSSSSSGIGFVGLLTVVFVIAKLWGVIEWSWWAVFSPVLIGMSIVTLFLSFLFAMGVWTECGKKKKYTPGKRFL